MYACGYIKSTYTLTLPLFEVIDEAPAEALPMIVRIASNPTIISQLLIAFWFFF